MNRPTQIGFGIVLASIALHSYAEAQDNQPLQFKTLDCLMKNRGTTSVENGKLSTSTGGDTLAITLTAFDYQKHTATMIGNAGADEVSFVPSMKKAVMIQFSQSGNGFLTSVSDPVDGKSMIFHSRHSWMMGQPIISEFQGTCTVRK